MKCPQCGFNDFKVVDSRDTDDGVRRRRECLACHRRFTTYERIQPAALYVIKKDGRREEFNKEKILGGLRKACEKRPITSGVVERIADDIEKELIDSNHSDISSFIIGDKVMEKLKVLDNIAYIRFASVYRKFTDISELKQEIDHLLAKEGAVSASQLTFDIAEPAGTTPKHSRRAS